MRKIDFYYNVFVDVELTFDEIHRLFKYADKHYDAKCQNAVKVGGFLYGFYFSFMVECGDSTSKRHLSISELDIVCKILEQVDGETEELVGFFRQTLRDAIAEYSRVNPVPSVVAC